jgi:hypothetical protein
MCKCQIPKNIFWQIPAHSGPDISGCSSKFKLLLIILFSPGPKVSKKVCPTHVGQKLRDEIDFIETACFWPRAVPLKQLV